ncbi:helix-turn-helix transcriptional regulator [Bacillus sp. JCM 19041]|uniref:helix-turn-helix domain-containing protein n=1 Tax=Bacillus sp. JCM 19041 TaxID=1460637 RepID=UPI0006CFBA22
MSEVRINLLNIMAERSITPSELLQESGLSKQTVSAMLFDESKQLSFETLSRVCHALQCEIQDVLLLVENE